VKRYKYFYANKIGISKQLYRFKPQNFLDEAIQVLLRQKIESTKQLYRFKPQKLLF
jgi:hypothetical protein